MKQRIYRNYFWVALTTILIVSFVFVFSYNRTIHDQKEEGMREEAEFISALLEKQGDADVGFQAAAGKTDFRITLIAENGMVLYDNKVKDVSGMENHAKRPEILKARTVKVPAAVFPVRSNRRLIIMHENFPTADICVFQVRD